MTGEDLTGGLVVQFPDPTRAQLDAVLAFLPIFDHPGYIFGEWQGAGGSWPSWLPGAETSAFLDALYQEQLLVGFDWVAWSQEAHRYIEGGEAALVGADLTTLRMLLTAHVRADRFVEGTLASLFERGHIVAILRRLRQIRDTMAAA